jgi:hypothetical protein
MMAQYTKQAESIGGKKRVEFLDAGGVMATRAMARKL